jgi:hypothetical protein
LRTADRNDTTLKGADVKAHTIAADVKGKLAVESVQDTVTQHNQQSNAGLRVQVALGTAWEVSGNASHANANGSSIAVAEQSGLFAGDGGYHVKADSIALKGGAIASTSVDNSELTAKAVTFEHVANRMDFKAQGVSVSGGFTTGSVMESKSAAPAGPQGVAEAPAQTSTGARNPNVTPALPTQDKGNDTSTTYATLTDGKLNIGGQAMESAASLGAHTDASSASKAIEALPDLKVVMAEQKALAAASGTVIAAGNQIAGDIAKAARDEGAKATAAIKKADDDIASARTVLGDANSTAEQRAQAEQGLSSATQRRADAEQAGLVAQKSAQDWSEAGDKARALKAATGMLVGAVGGQSNGLIAANAVAPYVYKAIGDLAQEKTKPYTDAVLMKSAAQGALDALNAQDDSKVDPTQRAQLEQLIKQADAALVQYKEQYDNWADGSVNKIALHALATAALSNAGGGSALDGAIAGGLNEAKAPILDGLTKDLDAVSQKFVAELASLGVGVAVGNAQTASLTLDAERNNRQLHPDETARIKRLAGGDAKKEARLTAAACAIVRCYAEFPVDSAAYTQLKNLAAIGASADLASERQQLATQSGLFSYSTDSIFSDAGIDAAKQLNNTYQVSTRALGAGQMVIGGLGVAGSIVTAPASCATGVGCIANATVGTISLDASYAGAKQLVSGSPEDTFVNTGLQTLGLSPQAASIVEAALGIGSAATAAKVANKAVEQTIALGKLSAATYQDFTTNGIRATPAVMATSQAQALVMEIKTASPGLSNLMATNIAKEIIESGVNLPQSGVAASGTVLIKVVPKGAAVSEFSPYWMTPAQASRIATLPPEQVGQLLGLPAAQSASMLRNGLDFYAISPSTGVQPKIFVSQIAPTTQGVLVTAPNAQQVIVPNRNQWTRAVQITPPFFK